MKLTGVTSAATQETVEDDLMRYAGEANIVLSFTCCCNVVHNVQYSAVIKWICWIVNDLQRKYGNSGELIW